MQHLCGEDPLSDFDTSDHIITTIFPHAFLLGHAYGWPAGNWTVVQQHH